MNVKLRHSSTFSNKFEGLNIFCPMTVINYMHHMEIYHDYEHDPLHIPVQIDMFRQL